MLMVGTALLGVPLLFAGSASANTVTLEVTGNFSNVAAGTAVRGVTVNSGATFVATFTFDPAQLGATLSSSDGGISYWDASYQDVSHQGSYSLFVDGTTALTYSQQSAASATQWEHEWYYGAGNYSGSNYEEIVLGTWATGSSNYLNADLTLPVGTLADTSFGSVVDAFSTGSFTSGRITVIPDANLYAGYPALVGDITSISVASAQPVPLPSSAALTGVGLALAALGCLRHRRVCIA